MIKIIFEISFHLIFIFIGVILYFAKPLENFGLIIIILTLISSLINIFSNDVKKIISKLVEEEQSIKIRERNEKNIEKNTNILFALIISGAFIESKIYANGLGIGLFLILVILYHIIDKMFLEKYKEYTNELILKKEVEK
jgi:uncharacterized membrane protein